MITEHQYVAPVDVGNAVIVATRNAQGRCMYPIGWELAPDGTRVREFYCSQSLWQHMEQ